MAINKLITQGGTWVVTILLARILTPTDYGLVGMAGLVVGIVSLVGDFGLSVSLIQKKELAEDEISALFWQYLVIGALLALLVYGIAPLGVQFWGEPQLLGLMRLSAVPLLLNSLSEIPAGLLRREMRFKEFGLANSFAALVGSLVSIIFAIRGYGAYSLVWGTVGLAVAKCIFVYYWQPFRPRWIWHTPESRGHLKFGATVTLQRYLWWYYSNIDFWLASKFLGKQLYGIYSLAFYMASAPMEKVLAVVNPVAYPTFSRLEDRNELIGFYFELIRKTAYLALPSFLLLFWVAEDLLTVLLGPKWAGTIPVFKTIVVLSAFRLISAFNAPLLNAVGRPDIGLKNMIIGAVLATVAFSIGVSFGMTGLIVAWLSFYPLFFAVYQISVARLIGFTLLSYILNIIKPLSFSAVMFLVLDLLLSFLPALEDFFPLYGSNVLAIFRMGFITLVSLSCYTILVYRFDKEFFLWCCSVVKRRRTA